MGRVAVLEDQLGAISARARPYPAHLLREKGTALGLFSAAYEGHNDVIHFARKGMTATCVDTDIPKLYAMREIYPDDWRFVVSDAWSYALSAVKHGDTWDAVSVDTFLGDAEERSMSTLDLWCSLSTRLVTVTIDMRREIYAPPDGWSAYVFPRSSKAGWLVLRR